MRKRCTAALIGSFAALALVAAQPAAASTTIGNPCTGNASSNEFSFAGLANAPGSPFPAAAPSAGVITSWTFRIVEVPPNILSQVVKVLHPTGAPSQFTVTAESSPGSLVQGANTFATRLPIQAGDVLATSGTAEGTLVTVYCNTATPGDKAGVLPGNPTQGATTTAIAEPEGLQIPITAVIEPDADGDGYGDETQDKCPQSAAVQGECPVVVLDSYPVPKRNAVVVVVATSTEAPVSVSARAKLPRTKKGKKKAKASAAAKVKNVTRTVTPGKLGRFVLKFPGNLKRALRSLPKGRKLNLKITATATSVAGQVSTDKVTLKLRGQLKAKKARAKSKKG